MPIRFLAHFNTEDNRLHIDTLAGGSLAGAGSVNSTLIHYSRVWHCPLTGHQGPQHSPSHIPCYYPPQEIRPDDPLRRRGHWRERTPALPAHQLVHLVRCRCGQWRHILSHDCSSWTNSVKISVLTMAAHFIQTSGRWWSINNNMPNPRKLRSW